MSTDETQEATDDRPRHERRQAEHSGPNPNSFRFSPDSVAQRLMQLQKQRGAEAKAWVRGVLGRGGHPAAVLPDEAPKQRRKARNERKRGRRHLRGPA